MLLLDWELKNKIRFESLTTIGSNVDEHISLLSYVDDFFITVKASPSNCIELLDSFNKFKKWTGLSINISKSSFMVLPSLDLEGKREIVELLRFQNIGTW